MTSAQRMGTTVVAGAGVLMLALVVVSCTHDLAGAMREQHRDHVACSEARIEAAQRGEQDLRARGEGQDRCVHGGDAAVKPRAGA
jgi:hypothetical protein